MKKTLQGFFLVVVAALLTVAPAPAQDNKDKSGVTISWEEFRKLLALDKDEIDLSWEEFQQILRQTGFKYVPSFQLKDERVVLTRPQFRELLNRMKPPADPALPPPAEFLLTQAAYKGRVAAGSAQFHASLNLEVFERAAQQYSKIPLFPLPLALKEALLDGTRALMILENGRHTLMTSRPGRHLVDVDFSLKTALEQGPWIISFPIPQTAVTRFEVDLPYKDIEVDVANAQQLEVTERGALTHIEAFLSPSDSIRLSWRKRPQEVKKGPAKIYADTTSLLSVEDDALRVGVDITLSILQNSISSVTLGIPAGWKILDVRGNGIEDWRETVIKDVPYLDIRFEYPKQGTFAFSVVAEKLLAGAAADFNGFSVLDAVREKGFLGVELKSTSEVSPVRFEGLDKLDVSELPAALINRSPKPLLLGYKYLHHPYSLNLEIKKHEELPVIGTVADSASGVTLFTEDGKLVHRVIYSIRNTSKQFLELELPKTAQVWSVFVGGEPVKPRTNENRILIPLIRSVQGAEGLTAFDVELIYFERAERFSSFGRGSSFFPVPDIIISQMLWSVYLPDEYKFIHFGGTVEKEKTAAGFRLLLGGRGNVVNDLKPDLETSADNKGQKDKDRREAANRLKSQFSPSLALSEAQISLQMKNEAGFGQRIENIQNVKGPSGTGILSIRIQIPTSGQVFRFAKTLVNEEPMTLDFRYISDGMFSFLRFVVLLMVLIAMYTFRRRLLRATQELRGKIRDWKLKGDRLRKKNPPDFPAS